MTEGIIQKVFKNVRKAWSEPDSDRIFNDNYYNLYTCDLINALEQELIKEIRNYWKKCNDKKMYQELREIIGDSKE